MAIFRDLLINWECSIKTKMSAYAHGDLGSSLPMFKCLVCKFEPNNHLKDVGGEGDGDELAIELKIDVPGNNEQLGSSEGFRHDS